MGYDEKLHQRHYTEQVEADAAYAYTHPKTSEIYIATHPPARQALERWAGVNLDRAQKKYAIEYLYANKLNWQNPPRPTCPYGNCGAFLGPHDITGTTFFIACNMMLAFALFFFVQVSLVPKQWKNSVLCAGLVCGIAWYNYTFMKDQWVHTQISPTTFRYTDWLITVPLQIVEFYLILKASGPVNPALGSRMFLASLFMSSSDGLLRSMSWPSSSVSSLVALPGCTSCTRLLPVRPLCTPPSSRPPLPSPPSTP